MADFFAHYFSDLITGFTNPEKRVFIAYLASACGIALLWLGFKNKQGFKHNLKFIFSPSVWCSPSAKADYLVFLINRLFMLILSPHLVTQLTVATALFFWFHDIMGERSILLTEAPNWAIALVFTTCFFIIDDFSRYFVHRLLHRWPLLWEFHKVHHSAESLTPITVFRTHPVEAIIFSLRSIAVQAVMISTFVFFMGDRADLVTLFGANIFIFTFNLLGSNLRHSHIPIAYWKPLEKIFLSPAQHQIHHSVDEKHWNKNYGVALAIWDVLGHSHYHSETQQDLSFGLSRQSLTEKKQHTLYTLYLAPFRKSFSIVAQFFILPKAPTKPLHEKSTEEKPPYEYS